MGWSTPRARIESASAASASSSKARRGWLGFDRMTSRASSRSAGSSLVLGGMIAARPRPIPRLGPGESGGRAGSATRGPLLSEPQVSDRSGASGVVPRDGQTEARRLADPHVARDDRFEDELRKVLAELAIDV